MMPVFDSLPMTCCLRNGGVCPDAGRCGDVAKLADRGVLGGGGNRPSDLFLGISELVETALRSPQLRNGQMVQRVPCERSCPAN